MIFESTPARLPPLGGLNLFAPSWAPLLVMGPTSLLGLLECVYQLTFQVPTPFSNTFCRLTGRVKDAFHVHAT